MKKYVFLLLFLTQNSWADMSEQCIALTAYQDYAEEGQGIDFSKLDWETSIPVCQKAVVGSKDFRVLYGLGRAYSAKGESLKSKQDDQLSYKYFEESYNLGFKHAAYVLASEYSEDENWEKTDYWLDLSIQTGKVLAKNLKALLLFDDAYKYPVKDFEEADNLLRSVSDSNNEYVSYNLARLHYFDEYDLVDYEISRTHFEKSAELGRASSLNKLGTFYFSGLGVPKNNKKALDYFLKAKKRGATSEFYDQKLIQSAMNVWLSSKTDEGYQYYDIAINTLRELAAKGNEQSLKFLRQQRVGLDVKVSSLDSLAVKNESDKLIKNIEKYSNNFFETMSDKDLSLARDAFNEYAGLMIDNGLYNDPIQLYEKSNTDGVGPFSAQSQYYLSLIYSKLYVDYKNRSDAVKSIVAARATGDESTLNSILNIVSIATDNENDFESILVSAKEGIEDNSVDAFLNRYDNALKKGMNDMVQVYLDNSPIDINAQRSNDGVSMLHLAIWYGNVNITKQLVEKGADINLSDHEGDKPLGYAIHKKNMDLIAYLSSKGAKN